MRERSNVSDCSGNVSRHNGLLTGSDQPHVIRHRAVNVVGQVGNPIVADGNRERDEAVAIFLRIVKDGEIGEFSNERLKKGKAITHPWIMGFDRDCSCGIWLIMISHSNR